MSKKIFLLLISICLIICQEANKTEEPKETNNENVQVNLDSNTTNDETNNTQHTRRKQRNDFNSKIPFNMTIDEMDTMILCTGVVQEFVKRQKTEIEALQKRLNISSPNPIYEKVGTDIFENCNKWLIDKGRIYLSTMSQYHYGNPEGFSEFYNNEIKKGKEFPGMINDYKFKDENYILHAIDPVVMLRVATKFGFTCKKIELSGGQNDDDYTCAILVKDYHH